jgi:hypothetical protein
MPIVLKHNIATELGLSNGSRGVLVDVKLDPREPVLPTWQPLDTEPVVHRLAYQPLALLVRFPNCKLTTPLEPSLSMDPKVVAVRPMKRLFKYILNPTQPDKTKRKIMRIQRLQFPVYPGYAVTVHGAQGESLDGMISDLDTGLKGVTASIAQYVILSRPVDKTCISLLKEVKYEDLCHPPDPQLLHEQHRLELLGLRSVMRHRYRIPGLLQSWDAYVQKRLECQIKPADAVRPRSKKVPTKAKSAHSPPLKSVPALDLTCSGQECTAECQYVELTGNKLYLCTASGLRELSSKKLFSRCSQCQTRTQFKLEQRARGPDGYRVQCVRAKVFCPGKCKSIITCSDPCLLWCPACRLFSIAQLG